MKTIEKIIYFFLIITFLFSCQNSGNEAENIEETTSVVELTKDQIAFNKMEIGRAAKQMFSEEISCKGYIKASPKGMAAVSSPMSGIVKEIKVELGKYLKKGQVICTVSTNELIDIQQQYSEAAAIFSKLEAEYNRKEKLYAQQVVSEKDFLAVKSEYLSTKVSYQSLKLQVLALNLDPVQIENGKLFNHFPILATIGGYVSNISFHLGQYVEPSEKLIEIVDPSKFHLELSVFENELKKLKVGQEVRFDGLDNQNPYATAHLYSIGKSINKDDKTITCLASIMDKNKMGLVNGAFIEAKILLGSSEAMSIPTEALLKSGQSYFVFQIDSLSGSNYYISPLSVETGRSENNFTEIVSQLPDKEILLKGAYNLNVE